MSAGRVRRSAQRAALLALVAALAPLLLPRTAHAAGCRVSGSVALGSKLVCPMEPVTLRFALELSCDDTISCVRSVKLVDSLPEGMVAWNDANPGMAPDTAGEWTLEFTDDFAAPLVSTREVTALRGGEYAVGAAKITLEDDEGRRTTTHLAPADLTVVSDCGGRQATRLYLPLLHRPRCLPSPRPADIVLAVDRSASVGGGGVLAAAREAAVFLDHLDLGRDRVAVVAFDQTAHVVAPLGASRPTLNRALRALRSRHGTRLEGALDTALLALDASSSDRPGSRRKVVILVSDGVPIGPRGHEAALEAAARVREAGARILSLGVGPAADHELLAQLSEPGAPAPRARQGPELARAYRMLAEAVACLR